MEQHDLLLIVDALSYGNCYLRSLTASFPKIISISAHTGCFSRIGVLVYRNYHCNDVLEWSGWLNQGQHEASQEQQPDLIAFVKRLCAKRKRKRSYRKAVKTTLAKACQVMRAKAKTLIFLYADMRPVGGCSNGRKEKAALLVPGSYSRYGSTCIDWVSACNALRDGPKQAQVFAILAPSMGVDDAAWYTYLSTRTDGTCVQVKSYLPEDVTKVTIDLFLSWMGVEKAPYIDKCQYEDNFAELLHYISVREIDSLENEKDMGTYPYFSTVSRWPGPDCHENIIKVKLTADIMTEYVPKKTAPMPDFTEEIVSLINSVPDAEMYPCIFLDPTLSFTLKGYDPVDRSNKPISYLTRSELLHIGRSCNPGVLRRFGAILTRLTVVVSASKMPDHISNTTADHVRKTPFVLATEKYNRQFWKVLLHIIEPGTKLSARSATLLAALSLRMGIRPLMKLAEQEMLAFKDKWNDLSTPQTWTVGCLRLLIDADEAHQNHQHTDLGMNRSLILNPTDRTLFERLISCQAANLRKQRPFQSETIFQLITRVGSEEFLSRKWPFTPTEPQIRYDEKSIHNSKEVISTFGELIGDCKTINNKCSLCYSAFEYSYLHPACGHIGCLQRMCSTCLAA
ncbi:hypothetical protein N7517_004539 [Penicillium concentricum]|uniref:Uncharacterized protein n=1 Tax=Penicillium concentricum TaxID=293559 RepID=A0A9W9V892_9EURO|nr:uncharacterized protein N7517_004539 [Penicillium concentricum]KAJ5372533.1 hypothetical protein N7517_004539 [Penicillium concentricum]